MKELQIASKKFTKMKEDINLSSKELELMFSEESEEPSFQFYTMKLKL